MPKRNRTAGNNKKSKTDKKQKQKPDVSIPVRCLTIQKDELVGQLELVGDDGKIVSIPVRDLGVVEDEEEVGTIVISEDKKDGPGSNEGDEEEEEEEVLSDDQIKEFKTCYVEYNEVNRDDGYVGKKFLPLKSFTGPEIGWIWNNHEIDVEELDKEDEISCQVNDKLSKLARKHHVLMHNRDLKGKTIVMVHTCLM